MAFYYYYEQTLNPKLFLKFFIFQKFDFLVFLLRGFYGNNLAFFMPPFLPSIYKSDKYRIFLFSLLDIFESKAILIFYYPKKFLKSIKRN